MRLAVDAGLNQSRSLAAIGIFLKDPNYINTQFNIPVGTVVTSANVQQLTTHGDWQYVRSREAFQKLLRELQAAPGS